MHIAAAFTLTAWGRGGEGGGEASGTGRVQVRMPGGGGGEGVWSSSVGTVVSVAFHCSLEGLVSEIHTDKPRPVLNTTIAFTRTPACTCGH